MVPQHQFNGMGVEIVLSFKVCLAVFERIVVEERNGHHEGYEAPVVSVDYIEELAFFLPAQLFFKVSHDVMKDVGVLT